MSRPRNIPWRGVLRRRIKRGIAIALLVALVLAAIGPSLIPSGFIAEKIATTLAEATGRRIHVTGCRLGWFGGLRVDELWIDAADGDAGQRPIQIQGLRLAWQPWEMPEALSSETPDLGRVTIDQFIVHVTRRADGTTNLPDLATGTAPPRFKDVEVLDGNIMWVDQATGTRRSVSGLRISVGRLEGTEKVHLTVGGRLLFPDAQGVTQTGRVSISGLLDHVDLAHPERITGGCDIDWKAVDLAYLVPHADGPGQRLSAPTDGQASITLDVSDVVTFEFGISAPKLTLREADDGDSDVEMDRPSLSVSGTFDRRTREVVLKPFQLYAAGSSIGVTGTLTVDPDGRPEGNLSLDGTLSWAPLKREVQVLGRALGQLTSATGTARIDAFDLTVDGTTVTFDGAVDLSQTELSWRPYFHKPTDRPTAVRLAGRVDLATGRLDLADASLRIDARAGRPRGEPAELQVAARTVLPEGGGADAQQLEIDLAIPGLDRLPRYVPAAAAPLERLGAEGPLAVRTTVDLWTPEHDVDLRIDATEMALRREGTAGKPAGVAMVVDLRGRLGDDDATPPELTRAVVTFGPSLIEWAGSLRPTSPTGEATESAAPNIIFDGRVDARGIEQWFRLVRHLLPERPHVGVVGNLAGAVSGRYDGATLRGELDANATLASLEVSTDPGRTEPVGQLLMKPLGKAARLSAGFVYDWPATSDDADRLEIEALLSAGDSTVTLAARDIRGVAPALAAVPARLPERLSLEVTGLSADIAPLVSYLPAVAAALEPYDVRGGATWSATCAVNQVGFDVRLEADLTDTEYTVPDERYGLTKAAGLRQVLVVGIAAPREAAGRTAEVTIDPFVVETGPCRLAGSGRAGLDADTLRASGLSALAPRLVRSVALNLKLDVVQDEALGQYSRWWRRLTERSGLAGRATAELRLEGTRDRGRLQIGVDATQAGFEYGEGTRKPVGVRADANVVLQTTDVAGRVELAEAALRIADTELDGTGTVEWAGGLASVLGQVPDFALHVECHSEELARLGQLAPAAAARELGLRGGLDFSVDIAADRYGTEIDNGELTFRGTHLAWHGTDVGLDGRVRLGRQKLETPRLQLSLGDSALVVVADVTEPFRAPDGHVAVAGPRLDLDQVMSVLGAGDDGVPPDSAAGSDAAAVPDEPVGIPESWPEVADFLAHANLRGRVALDRFSFTDKLGVLYDWDTFTCDLAIGGGRIDVENLKAVMLGGVVNGRVGIDLALQNPQLTVEYSARNITGGEEIAPLIEVLFPDMTVAGKVTQIEQVTRPLFATADAPNYPEGLSQFDATDGKMTGPAAPEWMTNLLPGLKLTTYAFRQVRSVSELSADGRADSLMLFDGSPYAIYIDGHTLADGAADYTLGVDLFGSLNRSEAFQRLEQGWVPLLRYRGRIADSRWVERTIEYKLPHEVAYEVFLKRNLLTKLLEQRGETRRPDFDPYDFDQVPDEKKPKAQ